jgi:hypothetical protein
MSFGTSVVFFGLIVVVGGIADLVHWAVTPKAPGPVGGAAYGELVKDMREEIGYREKQVKTIKVQGTLRREKWDGATKGWVAAGENVSSAIYQFGALGRVRVECTRDAAEGVAGGERSFVSVFDGKVGVTLAHNAAGMQEVDVEMGRPAAMEGSDEATGWRYTFLGRWIGAQAPEELFSELLRGDEAGTALAFEPNQTGSFVKVMATRGNVEEMFSVDVGEGYAFDAWEERVAGVEGAKGILRRSMNVSRWWILGDIFYPQDVEAVAYGTDGAPAVRERIHVSSFTMDPKTGEQAWMRVEVPGGKLRLRAGGKEKVLEGTAEENDRAVQAAWDAATNE